MMRNEYFTLALPTDAGADADLLGRLAPAAPPTGAALTPNVS